MFFDFKDDKICFSSSGGSAPVLPCPSRVLSLATKNGLNIFFKNSQNFMDQHSSGLLRFIFSQKYLRSVVRHIPAYPVTDHFSSSFSSLLKVTV